MFRDHPLQRIQPFGQRFHFWPKADTGIRPIPAGATTTLRINIKECPRNRNHFFFQARFKERQTVIQRLWQSFKIGPNIKCSGRFTFHANPHLVQPLQHIVPLFTELTLCCHRFLNHMIRLEQAQHMFLERIVCSAIQERARTSDCVNNRLWCQCPADTPTGIAPVLGQSINNNDRVFVDIFNIFGRRNHLWIPVSGSRIDVMGIKLIKNQRATQFTRHFDPLLQLRSLDHLPGRVTGIAHKQRFQSTAEYFTLQVTQWDLVTQFRDPTKSESG